MTEHPFSRAVDDHLGRPPDAPHGGSVRVPGEGGGAVSGNATPAPARPG
jgi:hypothetical protein